jgi:hypothetical protein
MVTSTYEYLCYSKVRIREQTYAPGIIPLASRALNHLW